MQIVFCFDCEGTEEQIRSIADVADERGVCLTIFVLGETARAYPALFLELAQRHEIHTHSDRHVRHRGLTRAVQSSLIRDGRKSIEDAIGKPVSGFRAPYHSFDRETVAILNEEQFLFDASALYQRYDMGSVIELRPSWFREWAPWYRRFGVSPDRAFDVFRWLARWKDPLVLPVHPGITGASRENVDALDRLFCDLRTAGGHFTGGEQLVRSLSS